MSLRIPEDVQDAHRHPEYLGLPRRASKAKVYAELLLRGWRDLLEERRAQAELAVYAAYEHDPERRAAAEAIERMSLRGGVV